MDVIQGREPQPNARVGARAVALQYLRWIIGLAVLAWVIRANGGWRVLRLPIEFPGAIAALTLSVFVGATVEAQRLRILCNATVATISYRFSWRLVAVASLFSTTLPGGTGGDVVKLITLDAHRAGHRAEFLVLLFLDRLVGLVSLLIVGLMSFALSAYLTDIPVQVTSVVVMPSAALLGAVALIAYVARSGPRTMLLRMIPPRWTRLHGLLQRAFRTADLVQRRPGVLARALAVSSLAQLSYAIAFAISARLLMPEANPLLAPSLAFIGLIVNAIPLTPSGIGVGEAAFETLFRLHGVPGGARLLLCLRIAQLALAVVGAVLYLHRGVRSGVPDSRSTDVSPQHQGGGAAS
ncbi:MAG TPA: lysylphosphatidylglycerol synthase transmembrane domain-containing protein [Gemmatimonadaceae bacterium]